KDGQRTASDSLTGTLTSPEFTVRKPYIRFLIGGGNIKDQTCVNLLVNGKTVRQAYGKNQNRMDWAFWDVRDLAGKQAQIQVVDNAPGGWDNSGLDHILSSDHSSAYTGAVPPVAAERKLDAEALPRWVKPLREVAPQTPADPFHAWSRLITAQGDFPSAAREV